MADEQKFLARWARRKEQARQGTAPEVAPVVTATPVRSASLAPVAPVQLEQTLPAPVADPLPTLADVALLTRDSDYARFVTPGVDEGVKQAAMKKLFSDPHFNVMDGLDTYIDDYGKADPIPLAMLRQMTQSRTLRLFEHEEEDAQETPKQLTEPLRASTDNEPLARSDDDADLRLQQDNAAGRRGPDQGAGA